MGSKIVGCTLALILEPIRYKSPRRLKVNVNPVMWGSRPRGLRRADLKCQRSHTLARDRAQLWCPSDENETLVTPDRGLYKQ